MYEDRLGDFLGTILDAARFHPFLDRLRFPRLRLAYWRRFRPSKYALLEHVNLGAGISIREGFLNVDVVGPSDLHFNFLNPFPLPTSSTRFVYCEHALEHFHLRHVPHILSEVHRILRPGGIVRISVPYVDVSDADPARLSTRLFDHDHRSRYTPDLLRTLLREAGFAEVAIAKEGESPWLDVSLIHRIEHRTTESIVVEARRSG